MTDYYIEERSGVIEFGPLSYPVYPRQTKVNWRSLKPWLHLLCCILAIPLIIWNLYLMLDLIEDANNVQNPRQTYYGDQQQPSAQLQAQTQQTYPASQPALSNERLTPQQQQQQQQQQPYKDYHWFGFTIAFCAIFTYLFAGVLVLIVEASGLSEKLAKFLYVIVYLSIAISVFVLLVSYNVLGPIFLILILILLVLYGFGFARFLIVSGYNLNEDGPAWMKPVIYGCLAFIPLLSTIRQCKGNRQAFGCLPNDYYFGGRVLYQDYFSFCLMFTIFLISLVPTILRKPQQQKSYDQS